MEPLYWRTLGDEELKKFVKIVQEAGLSDYFARYGIESERDFQAAYKSRRLYDILDRWRHEHLDELKWYEKWLIPRDQDYCTNLEGEMEYLCPFFDLRENACLYLDTDLCDDLKICCINLEDEPEPIFAQEELERLAAELRRCGRKSDFLRFCDFCYDLIYERYDLGPYLDLFVEYGSFVVTKESAVVLLYFMTKYEDERIDRIFDEKIDLIKLLSGYGFDVMEVAYYLSIFNRKRPEPKELESKEKVIERYRSGVIYLQTDLPWVCERVMLDRAFIAYYPRSENEVLEADAYLVEVYDGLDEICKIILRSAYRAASAKLNTKCFVSLRPRIKRCFKELELESLKKEYVDTLKPKGVDRLLMELECDIELDHPSRSIESYKELLRQMDTKIEHRLKFEILRRRKEGYGY